MENAKRMIYSTKDIKEILGAGNSTLQELLNREENPIPHFRIGRRIIIPCDLFHQWLNSQATRNREANN